MAYKTIFTPMTRFDAASAALSMSTGLASAQDAHLDVLCLGLDRVQAAFYEMGSNAMVMQAAIEEAQQKAHSMGQDIDRYMEKQGVRWETYESIGNIDGVAHTISARARFADLSVVDLPYGDNCRAEDPMILESLLFVADCPTIVVPQGAHSTSPEKIVVAWNESAEAMHAIRLALPFLKAAKEVHIAIVDPAQRGPERSDPGGPLAVYLYRHGVSCDIQVMTSGGKRVSERLAQHVTESTGDMLVMGGYGHSRFREAVLGGATREMLEHAKVPVFMAH